MTEERFRRARYFLISFAASFFMLSLLFLFLMTTISPGAAPETAGGPRSAEEEPYAPEAADALTVLLVGSTDNVAGTFLLAGFDPAGGAVNLAVFPAKTLVGEETLGEAYRYGGARYTKDVLAAYLGIPIDRYVRLERDSFIKAAAAVGTVEIDLAREVVLAEGDLEVVLRPGRQLLDGRKIADLLAREEPDEAARCALVLQLAAAAVDQRIDLANSVLVDKVFETVVNLVDTDISYGDYEQRKAAAAYLAGLEGAVAAPLGVEGSFSADGKTFSLTDTAIATLRRRFL